MQVFGFNGSYLFILTSTVLSADEIGYIVCTDHSQQSS